MNARDIAAAVSSRRASAVEMVRDALDRIAAAKALNAVVTVNTERLTCGSGHDRSSLAAR